MSPDVKDLKTANENFSPADPSVETLQLGVWKVSIAKNPAVLNLKARWHKIEILLPIFKRLTYDFLTLAPIFFPLLCLQMMFLRVVPTLKWHLLNRSLFLIEAGLTQGRFDTRTIALAVAAHTTFGCLIAILEYWRNQFEHIVQTRIVQHFEGILFKLKVTADLRMAKEFKNENNEKNPLNVQDVWYTYRCALQALGRVLSILAQLSYITTLVDTKKELLIYVILFLIKPFTKDLLQPSLWDKPWTATSTNPSFNRMESLKSIASDYKYKQETISNGKITEYLVEEYGKARQSLGDASASYPPAQYATRERVELGIVSALLGDLHMFYCFASAVLRPSRFILSKVLMLPKAGDLLVEEIDEFLEDLHNTHQQFDKNLVPFWPL
ncbi:hypothetical protein C8F04DRAFT_111808 [Mycena alexandri]|uniref:Uncharacterized protein n=1 Tax=Mycena alexandri TaxID=1745969 RepID=A0AAD6TAR4_9AGAR|nr:hypothetical protein C8F04DRAFT_111808 [Mycena alexandri]